VNFYPFHIGDYASATAHLSIVEDGVYRRLLDVYYVREAPIPADTRQVYRLVRAQSDCEREAVETILREFFTETPEGWRHSRCDAEIARANDKKRKAKESAEARWGNAKAESEPMRPQCDGNANAYANAPEQPCERMKSPCEGNAPNPNPNPKEENTPLPPASGGRDRPGRATTSDGFEQFWAAYPKRVSKGAARKAWTKLKPSEQLLQAILAGIGRAKTSAQWLRDDGRFVPHPATWLNAEGWLDDPPTSGGKPDEQWWLGRGFGTRESAIAAGAREPA
jgi:uncharacterized protein YdaU (DUF1376 family)